MVADKEPAVSAKVAPEPPPDDEEAAANDGQSLSAVLNSLSGCALRNEDVKKIRLGGGTNSSGVTLARLLFPPAPAMAPRVKADFILPCNERPKGELQAQAQGDCLSSTHLSCCGGCEGGSLPLAPATV